MNDVLLQMKTLSTKEPGDRINLLKLSNQDFMPDFQKNIQELQRLCDKIQTNTTSIADLTAIYTAAATPQRQKDISSRVNEVVKQTQLHQKRIKDLCKFMAEDISSRQQKDQEDCQIRIRRSMFDAWNKRVTVILKSLSQTEKAFRKSVKGKLERQLCAINPNLTQQQVSQLAQDPAEAQRVISQELVGPSTALLNGLADIEDKYRDIKHLESIIQELFQLTVGISEFVAQQGQYLNTIEQDLSSAKDYVTKGREHLDKGVQHHKSYKKKVCCFILIGVIIIAAVLAPILITQIK